MTVQTVKLLSELVSTPVEKLLTQMKEAGLPHSSGEQEVSEAEKQVLLNHLKRSHGEQNEGSTCITLQRKKTSTLKGGDNKTVNVEVRKKRTYVKRSDGDEDLQQELLEKRKAEEARLLAEQEARQEAELKAAAEKAEAERNAAAAKEKAEAEEKARLEGLTAQEASRLQQLQAAEASKLQQLTAAEQARLDQLMATGDFQVEMLDRRGQQYVEQMNLQRIASMYGLSASNLASSTQASSQAQANAASAFGNLAVSAFSSGLFDSNTSTTGGSTPLTTDNNLVPVYYGTGGGTEIDLTGSTNVTGGYMPQYNIPGGGYN